MSDRVLHGAVASVLALSGLVLFFAPSGYQGGRNPYYLQPVLFLNTHTWDILHTWSSIGMISGVGAHLVLHWNWMVCMTKGLLTGPRPARPEAQACPIE